MVKLHAPRVGGFAKVERKKKISLFSCDAEYLRIVTSHHYFLPPSSLSYIPIYLGLATYTPVYPLSCSDLETFALCCLHYALAGTD